MYKHEMTDKQHVELANVLNAVRGRVALSNYDCELLNRHYPAPKWKKHKSPPKTIHSTKDKREEVLWTNYEIEDWYAAKESPAKQLFE